MYVDDYIFLLPLTNGKPFEDRDVILLLFLVILGVPLAWKKTYMNQLNTWLGFLFDCHKLILQIAHPKLPALICMLDRLISNERHTHSVKWRSSQAH